MQCAILNDVPVLCLDTFIVKRAGSQSLRDVRHIADVDVRRAAYWPQIKARYDRTFGSGPLGNDVFMLALEYQPGAGLSSVASVREAEAKRNAARQQREAARRELRQNIVRSRSEGTAGAVATA